MTKMTIEIVSDCDAWIAGLRKLGSDFSTYFNPQVPKGTVELWPAQYEVVFASHTNPAGKTAEITVSTSPSNSIGKKSSVDANGELMDNFYFRITDEGEVR